MQLIPPPPPLHEMTEMEFQGWNVEAETQSVVCGADSSDTYCSSPIRLNVTAGCSQRVG